MSNVIKWAPAPKQLAYKAEKPEEPKVEPPAAPEPEKGSEASGATEAPQPKPKAKSKSKSKKTGD